MRAFISVIYDYIFGPKKANKLNS